MCHASLVNSETIKCVSDHSSEITLAWGHWFVTFFRYLTEIRCILWTSTNMHGFHFHPMRGRTPNLDSPVSHTKIRRGTFSVKWWDLFFVTCDWHTQTKMCHTSHLTKKRSGHFTENVPRLILVCDGGKWKHASLSHGNENERHACGKRVGECSQNATENSVNHKQQFSVIRLEYFPNNVQCPQFFFNGRVDRNVRWHRECFQDEQFQMGESQGFVICHRCSTCCSYWRKNQQNYWAWVSQSRVPHRTKCWWEVCRLQMLEKVHTRKICSHNFLMSTWDTIRTVWSTEYVTKFLLMSPVWRLIFSRNYSKTFPLCDGSHMAHNKATGDNLGEFFAGL